MAVDTCFYCSIPPTRINWPTNCCSHICFCKSHCFSLCTSTSLCAEEDLGLKVCYDCNHLYNVRLLTLCVNYYSRYTKLLVLILKYITGCQIILVILYVTFTERCNNSHKLWRHLFWEWKWKTASVFLSPSLKMVSSVYLALVYILYRSAEQFLLKFRKYKRGFVLFVLFFREMILMASSNATETTVVGKNLDDKVLYYIILLCK